MEMTIEESIKAQMFLQYNNLVFAEKEEIVAFIFREYEQRLKADMVAMFRELQLEIEKLDSRPGYSGNGIPTFSTDYIRKKKVNELIQQKINALTEDK